MELARGAWPTLLLNAVLPWATFQILTGQGVAALPALIATTIFPVAATLIGWLRSGRPDALGLLSILFIGLTVAVALATESELVVLLRSSVTNAAFALLCFGSLVWGRPLIFYAARQLVAGWNRAAHAAFDGQWEQPGFRQTMRHLTVAWGCWFTAQAIGRIVTVRFLDVSTFLAVWPLVSTVGTIAMIAWSTRYARGGAGSQTWDSAEDGARLNEQARRALERAEEEARQFRHGYLGTEHLLIGLCADENPAARILREYSVTEGAARTTLEMSAVPPGFASPLQERTYDPRLQAALRRADDAHREAGAAQIGAEHLLYGLTGDPDSQATLILAYMGVDVAQLRARLLALRAPPTADAAG